MNPLNVFNNPYYRWRYPDCWLKNARMFFRSFKYAYQRITRGWANCDTWDLDSYYSKIFNGTLNYLADNHWGYPGNDQFPNDESWTKYLKEMAQKFYQCDESNEYYDEPEENKWYSWYETHHVDDMVNDTTNPYIKTMAEETSKNWQLRETDMRDGLKMLADVYFNLWD